MNKKWPSLIFSTLGLVGLSIGASQAALEDLDRGPYNVASGRYPVWYQDANNLSLELCQSMALSSRSAGNFMCTLIPEPGVYDPDLPMIFPDNWPSELFWFIAETETPTVNGLGVEVYTAAIEAAFGGDAPVDGDQVAFARIRIRASVPIPGTYTVTHPYGVETLNVTDTGRRAINLTRDIGIGAPGDFTGALTGDVGPFLQSVNGPYQETNPETGVVESFVGDPNLSELVTGSPNGTNYVEITGPGGTVRNDLFVLSGKIHDARPATALEVGRTSYRRTAQGTRIEVFADSASDSNLCFRKTLALVGTPPSPCELSLLSDNNGHFFGHESAPQTLPQTVVVTASSPSGATRPTSASSTLVDVVKIGSARYSWADQRLIVEASSSDEVEVPDLVLQGFGPLGKSGLQQRLVVDDLPQPPARVTVKSSGGGTDSEDVLVVGSAPVLGENQPPLGQPDSATTSFGVPVTIGVLANDSDPDENLPLTVVDIVQPAVGQGSVAANGSTMLVYTPPAVVDSLLQTSFTYRVQDSLGARSEPVLVSVTVSPNLPPVVQPDTGSTLAVPLVINVLANDSDPENNVPLSIAEVSQPAQGAVSHDGSSLTYTPPTTITATFTATFTYRAQDSLGAVSEPATVTVTVSPPPATAENLTVGTAIYRSRSNDRHTWDLDGTSSISTGNLITIQVDTTNGLFTLGTASVAANGRWRLSTTTTGVVPATNGTARIQSSFGTLRIVPLTTR